MPLPDEHTSHPERTAHGRRRGFSTVAARREALRSFWLYGYDTTTWTDLGDQLKTSSLSLRHAFGTKPQLLRTIIDTYDHDEFSPIAHALAHDEDIDTIVGSVFRDSARTYTSAVTMQPIGKGALALLTTIPTPHEPAIRELLADVRRRYWLPLQQRLGWAGSTGETTRNIHATDLTEFIATHLQGLANRVRDGITATDADHVSNTAISAWRSLTTPDEPPYRHFRAGHATARWISLDPTAQGEPNHRIRDRLDRMP